MTAPVGHRSIAQPREPAFWLFAAFVAYGAVRLVEALSGIAGIAPSAWAATGVLLALYAAPAAVLVVELDLYEREPVSLAAGAFAWGAFAATALALDASGWDAVVAELLGADVAARWGPAITAPLVEETLKGTGIVLLYLIARDEVDDLMDGFVYGALCGLGFAVVEDVVFFAAAFGGSAADVLDGFAVRVIAGGLYGHVLYTGLVGMAVAEVVTRRHDRPLRRRLALAAALAAAGVAGHALWNSPILASLAPSPPLEGLERLRWLLVVLLRSAPLLGVVVLAVGLARRRERRWLAAALAPEVRADAIVAEEAALLADPRARRRAERAMRRRAGPTAARLLRRLHHAQVDLAMVAARVARPDDPALLSQRDRCRSLRAALHAIPGAAPAGATPVGARPAAEGR
jgi:RsiW-degrading membrane proteinase PrsW (M82 family)